MKKMFLYLCTGIVVCVMAGLLFAADSTTSNNDSVRYGDDTDHYSVRIGSVGGLGYGVFTGVVTAKTVVATASGSSVTGLTINAATLNGSITASGATITGGTYTNATLNRPLFGGTVVVGVHTGFTGVVTQKFDTAGYTNVLWIGLGIITNVTVVGTP